MHLFPELDSKAERVSGRFQLCRFRERGRERESGRERERMRETQSIAPLLNRCVLQSASDPRSCRKEGGASSKQERSRNKREGSSVYEPNDIHLLSLPHLKQEAVSLLSLPPLVLAYKASPNTCSVWCEWQIPLWEVQATPWSGYFYS